MVAQDVKASGALVIEAERISKAYDERGIVRDFSLRVMRRDRIGMQRQWRGQDHADQSFDWRFAKLRRGSFGRKCHDGQSRPAACDA